MKQTSKETPGRPRALGAHYSPRPVVDFVVGRTLGELLRFHRGAASGPPPRICDPACGAGVFLVSALDRLAAWLRRPLGGSPPPGWLRARIPETLFGVDVDPTAVAAARSALVSRATHWDPACEALDLSGNVVVGNSLVSTSDAPSSWRPVCFRERFPTLPEPGRFELVIGNPPFVDSEEMTRSAPELRRYLAARYQTAVGNWDLYCVFIERALQLMSATGRLGLIVPNKLLSAAYAQKTRRLLAEHDLVLLRDYSRVRLFDAAVYPLVLIAGRVRRRRPGLRAETVAGTVDAPQVVSRRNVARTAVVRSAGAGWSSLFAEGAQAGRAADLRPLGELCGVSGAASVSDAYVLQPLLRECRCRTTCFRLVNTGTIDPYRVLWGLRPTRYLGARYQRPCVSEEALEQRLPRRAAQARSPKIVVAGLSRRLECVLDPGGILAGKSTSLILPAPGEDGDWSGLLLLLGLLNSAAASAMLRRQFGGLTLSGGYLRIGPPQLRALRLPDPERIPASLRGRITRLAHELCELGEADESADDEPWRRLQKEIDEPCWELFGIAPQELR
ncbi:MAG: N-6 DNA methylase [bacterium]